MSKQERPQLSIPARGHAVPTAASALVKPQQKASTAYASKHSWHTTKPMLERWLRYEMAMKIAGTPVTLQDTLTAAMEEFLSRQGF